MTLAEAVKEANSLHLSYIQSGAQVSFLVGTERIPHFERNDVVYLFEPHVHFSAPASLEASVVLESFAVFKFGRVWITLRF